MALTRDKIINLFAQAYDIVNEQCKSIVPKGIYASMEPEGAWLAELGTFASGVALADGNISDYEVQNLFDLLCGGKTIPFSKTTMKMMGRNISDDELAAMPYALDTIIKRDNVSHIGPNDPVAVSIWYFYIYYWTAAFVLGADEIEDPREWNFANKVLANMHQKICNGLNMPYDTANRILNTILNAEI